MPDIHDPYERPHEAPDVAAGEPQLGSIGGAGLPFDLSGDEAERRYLELLEAEQRRRPPGFTAAWPEDDAA
jgi:hypothetical protein